jgi:hypothetical protein
MLEKASRLRLVLRIHRANPLSRNENLYVGFCNFQVLYSRTNHVPTELNFKRYGPSSGNITQTMKTGHIQVTSKVLQ